MRLKVSARKDEVARLLREGLSAPEIAERLGVGVKTIETHQFLLYKQVGVHSVAQLIRVMNAKDIDGVEGLRERRVRRTGVRLKGFEGTSNREWEVVKLVCEERLKEWEIGERLGISPNTVKRHKQALFMVLRVASTLELMGKYWKAKSPENGVEKPESRQ